MDCSSLFQTSKAVIFDLDGVLIDSMPLWQEASLNTLIKHGVPIEPNQETLKKFTGAHLDVIQKEIEQSYQMSLDWPAVVQDVGLYMHNHRERIQPIAGSLELLARLHRHSYPLALATSSPRSMVTPILEPLKIDAVFDVVICGDEIGRGKPEPDIFLEAAKKMEIDPTACLVIEDSINGIIAAKAANMRCLAITTTFEASDLQEADCIIDSFVELDTVQL